MAVLGPIVVCLAAPLAAAVPAGTAWARPHATARGSITCTVVAGLVRFSPPLSKKGTSNNEAVRFRLMVSGCTTADGSNLKGMVGRSFYITMHVPATSDNTANACATATPANGSVPATALARWKSRGLVVKPSILTTTGEAWSTGGSNVTVSLPGNGSATNNGTSFAGLDNGANSTIALTLALTGAQYAAVCDPATGAGRLGRSMVTGGTVSLGPTLFSGFTGSAAWTNGSDPLVPSDTDAKVLDLDSPHTCSASNGYTDCSFAGMSLPGVDGLTLAGVTALSFDFAVQTPGWTQAGGGSPRLVLLLSDGGNVNLNSEGTVLATGQWVHLDALTGVVDNVNGTNETCGTSGITFAAARACHGSATVTDAFVVNDSGWLASSGLDVWVDNLALNSTVTSAPIH